MQDSIALMLKRLPLRSEAGVELIRYESVGYAGRRRLAIQPSKMIKGINAYQGIQQTWNLHIQPQHFMIYLNKYVYLLTFWRKIMQVAKWGNSLAVRLPASVVQALDLKEGEEIDLHVAGERSFEVAKQPNAKELLMRLRGLRGRLPEGFRFDRLEAESRD